MSDSQKLYHWSNLILNPLVLFVMFLPASEVNMEPIWSVAVGWTLISAVLNEKLRSWVIKFFAAIIGGSAWVGWVGSIMGAVILIAVAVLVGMIGFFVILAFLWITSLKAIVDVQRGLV